MRNAIVVLCMLICAVAAFADTAMLPADAESSVTRLDESPRHGEWVTFPVANGDTVEGWIVYPERSDAAPVVVVVHEIFGLNDWARGVADQLAAEGFIAIAPDFLSGPVGQNSRSVSSTNVRVLIRDLSREEINGIIDGAVTYATALPAATDRFGIVGFCWGGGVSFSYATYSPDLDAAVVYYGTSPATESLRSVRAPVLGLYGESDNRVNATIPAAEAELDRLNKSFEKQIYDGAGHGFLRQLDGRGGANLTAAEKAWPKTIEFLRTNLEGMAMSTMADDRFATPVAYMHDADSSMTCEMDLGEMTADAADQIAMK